MNDQITTARLPAEIRNKLFALSRIKGKTKSDIIKESLDMYFDREENEIDSYTLGEGYFGRYASGDKDRSTSYKNRIKETLRAKLNSY